MRNTRRKINAKRLKRNWKKRNWAMTKKTSPVQKTYLLPLF
jgi:hypothetical protein